MEIVIGPDVGISYLTGKTSSVSDCTELHMETFIPIVGQMWMFPVVCFCCFVACLKRERE